MLYSLNLIFGGAPMHIFHDSRHFEFHHGENMWEHQVDEDKYIQVFNDSSKGHSFELYFTEFDESEQLPPIFIGSYGNLIEALDASRIFSE